MRKRRREEIRAAADAGEEKANAMLDAAAQRAREHRQREKDAADAVYFAGPPQGIAPWDHWAYRKLQQRADRKLVIRQPGVQARQAERARAREQRDAVIAAAKQHYERCQQELSQIRKEWYASRKRMARFSGGVLCTATTCRHKMCRNSSRFAEAEAAERQRLEREEDARQHCKDALEALCAVRRQPQQQQQTEAASDSWCCDVGGEGCIKPSDSAPEPAPPYVIWVCNARRPCNWCVCSAWPCTTLPRACASTSDR
mmetsp:Transcript_42495/g.85205  ORF Transcript_42495/g.85205 Transcript_42495/m.85205 type:complete len:257 (-) Transcript_42495:53-823(-)